MSEAISGGAGDEGRWVVFGRGGERLVSIRHGEMLRLVDALEMLSPDEFPWARSDADSVAALAAAATTLSEAPLHDVDLLDTPAIRHVAARLELRLLLHVLHRSPGK
jgi:hypothetical protein